MPLCLEVCAAFHSSLVRLLIYAGVTGAAAGTLTFMVGGSQADYDAAIPVLSNMGKDIRHCGDVGAGQVQKPEQPKLYHP